jgi:phosphate transport system protein
MEGHTVHSYDTELNDLHLRMLEMGALAMNQVESALQALFARDMEGARRVISQEPQVDALEVKIDEEVVSVIARRSPVARDLRTLVSYSKAGTDLERVGDEAARIAGLALYMYDHESSQPNDLLVRDINGMGKLAVAMLHEALEVFDKMDAERAIELVHGQTELDAEFRSSVRRLATFIMEDARTLGHALNVVLTIKALERIGDYSKNIAEYVIYLVSGQDIRHQARDRDEDELWEAGTPRQKDEGQKEEGEGGD